MIQAYHTLLPKGRFPVAVIYVALPPDAVDVNVHPAKTEVRFRRANAVFGAVQRAARETLISESPIPHATHFASFQSSGWLGATGEQAFTRRDEDGEQATLGLDWRTPTRDTVGADTAGTTTSGSELGGGRLPIVRVIGQVGASYIITEGPDGLYLIDQHAAHERILFEQFMQSWLRKMAKNRGWLLKDW